MIEPYSDEWQGIVDKTKPAPVFANSRNGRKKARKHLTKIKKHISLKRCRYCKTTENLTIDHKVPLVEGGTNDLKNLQVLCQKCNSMKSRMTDKQVRKLFKWFNEVQQSRVAHGKKPYTLK